MEPGALGRRRRRGGAFSIARLFANGEAGGVYDPSDLTAEKVAWRRNLLTWSEDFTNAAWTKSTTTVSGNTAVAPDGTTTADLVYPNTSGNFRSVFQTFSGTNSGQSVYAKAAGLSWIALLDHTGSANCAWFDVSTGVVGTVASGYQATIENAGNGWYRCSAVRTNGSLGGFVQITLTNGDNINTVTASGTNGVLFWGAQAERLAVTTAYQRITDFTSDFLAAFPTHGLYQDAAGTTPVTALGQPVGLVIDSKTGGLANTTRISINEGFDSGSTGWSAQVGWTISSGQASVNSATAGATYLRTATGCVVGQMYRITFTVTSYTSGTLFACAGTGLSLTGISRTGTFSAIITADATNGGGVFASGTTTVATVDNVVVELVPGVHAIQPTSSSRPLLDGRVNLLTRTEQFDHSDWQKINVGVGILPVVTANAGIAPDGTTTADRVQFDCANTGSASNRSSLLQPFTATIGASYRNALYIKAWDASNVGKSIRVTSDAINGAVYTLTADWQLVGTTGTAAATTSNLIIETRGTFTTQTADVLIWGADLRLAADAAYPYQRVAAATDYADVGVPRAFAFDGFDDSLYTASNMDFATVTSDGLARRNLLTNPSQFDDASWTAIGTKNVTANTTVAPDGTLTADTVTDSSAVAYQGITQTTTISSTSPYTLSLYVLKTTGGTSATFGVNWALSGGTGIGYNFRLNTDTGAVNGGWTAVSDGAYWRLTATASNAGGNNTSVYNIYPAAATHGSLSSDSSAATGSAVIWGAQLEAGNTATAFQNIGTDKVTVLAGVRKLSDAARGMLTETQGSPSNRVAIEAPSAAATADFMVQAGGSLLVPAASPATFPAPTTRVISALNDISGDLLVLRINGTQVASNTANQGTGNNANAVVNIGRRDNTSLPFNGKAYQLIVRGALTDAATLAQAERYVGAKTGLFL